MAINFNDTNVCLHYETTDDYQNDSFYLGATVGPICNRIADGRLSVNDKEYRLPLNEKVACLHSGGLGFDNRVWQVKEQDFDFVCFGLDYHLADLGMEGILNIEALYQVTEGELTVEYKSRCNVDTYINITNHAYFNLSGKDQDITDHSFSLFGEHFLVTNEQSLPSGEVHSFASPLHYSLQDQSVFAGGVDHHFDVAIDENEMRLMALATSSESGIQLSVHSNAPGYQFYTAKYLSNPFKPSGGFCIETQYAPDAINHKSFYSPLLKADEDGLRTTVFAFSQT